MNYSNVMQINHMCAGECGGRGELPRERRDYFHVQKNRKDLMEQPTQKMNIERYKKGFSR